MKVRLNVVLNASDDYSCGDCKKCPMHQESYLSTHQYEELKVYCPLGFNSISCPIEILKESEKENEEDNF